jgi:hypothetical protein
MAIAENQTEAAKDWVRVETIDEMEAFYFSRLPAIRAAAREHGYAIGVHGSARRDFDLIATPWREGASDKDTLAHAIAKAACGLTRAGAYDWEAKPAGRYAVSFPVCGTAWHDMISAGHIDLSVTPAALSAEIERLNAENFALAADQCHAGYGDEGGNHRCKEVDAAIARAAGRVEQARKDADFIDANMVCIGPQGHVFHPRGNSGNTIGLDYSAALRAEADRIEKGGE